MYVDVSSTIVHGPQNITVFSHSTVYFCCASDEVRDIYWKYAAVANGSSVSVFDRRGRNEKLFDDRFVNVVNVTTNILTISNVQQSDAGSYMCRESNSASYWSAHLTVIG